MMEVKIINSSVYADTFYSRRSFIRHFGDVHATSLSVSRKDLYVL
jgi:hypothetical protein